MSDRYAVMGNPIGHSKSPAIHAAFARQTGQDLSYTAILVEPGHFALAVAEFHQAGGRGLNITVPFKQEAFQLATALSGRARRAGAVNTLYWGDQDRLQGDTTDGVGLLQDLTVNHGVTIHRARVLVLGAGGAVRGVLEPLLAESPVELVIANRTVVKARQLANDFACLGNVMGCGFDELSGRFDLVINGTAAGLRGAVPPLPTTAIDGQTLCYDMMYGDEPTAFIRWAQKQGAGKTLDGLGMLVEQAAESFRIWRGVRPDTRPVITGLRAGALG